MKRLLIRGDKGFFQRMPEITYMAFLRTVDVACGSGVLNTVSFNTPELLGLIGVNIV